MLTAADLSSLRQTLRDSLPDTAEVRRATRTSDGLGGVTETWTAVATVSCRVAPLGRQARAEVVAALPVERAGWLITLPADTAVQNRDRVVVTSMAPARQFEVLGRLAPRSWELCARVVAVEVG